MADEEILYIQTRLLLASEDLLHISRWRITTYIKSIRSVKILLHIKSAQAATGC